MPVPHFSLGAFLDRAIIEVKHDAPRRPLHCEISSAVYVRFGSQAAPPTEPAPPAMTGSSLKQT